MPSEFSPNKLNFYIHYNGNEREYYVNKGSALRRAAALAKFTKAVIKVYDKNGNFIKSFDER